MYITTSRSKFIWKRYFPASIQLSFSKSVYVLLPIEFSTLKWQITPHVKFAWQIEHAHICKWPDHKCSFATNSCKAGYGSDTDIAYKKDILQQVSYIKITFKNSPLRKLVLYFVWEEENPIVFNRSWIVCSLSSIHGTQSMFPVPLCASAVIVAKDRYFEFDLQRSIIFNIPEIVIAYSSHQNACL